eukprot:3139602-Alexandrium_andersonii.AAC.1
MCIRDRPSGASGSSVAARSQSSPAPAVPSSALEGPKAKLGCAREGARDKPGSSVPGSRCRKAGR